MTVFEAKKGTELHARLVSIVVGLDQLESFVESIEKVHTNPDYEPKQVIQGAMRLSHLEEASGGKTYPEMLLDRCGVEEVPKLVYIPEKLQVS